MKLRPCILGVLLFGMLAVSVTSCASARKCDGRKATKTPMGNM